MGQAQSDGEGCFSCCGPSGDAIAEAKGGDAAGKSLSEAGDTVAIHEVQPMSPKPCIPMHEASPAVEDGSRVDGGRAPRVAAEGRKPADGDRPLERSCPGPGLDGAPPASSAEESPAEAPPAIQARRPSVTSTSSQGRLKVATGKPFPKRPMMSRLGKPAWEKLELFFRKMDVDCSNAVTRENAAEFFKGSFAKLSTDAMFNEVDIDGSGAITADEFLQFWTQVRNAGYSDQDIIDEVEQLMEGGAWVDWRDGRDTSASSVKFPKRPLFCKLSSKCWAKCEALFRSFDKDGTLTITRENATDFYKGSFTKVSVEAMFNEVDLLNHGAITAVEFMKFWVQVKSNGYKEKDIMNEIDQLMEGGSWVDWKDGRSTA